MLTIGLDFETYYDNDYSLRKMTPVEYVLDPRFETIGCAVYVNGLCTFMTPDQLITFIGKLRARGAKIACVSHNALFDMLVLALRFGYVPDLMIDTLGMSRAWNGHKYKSHSISSLAVAMGFGTKGTTVNDVRGMRLKDIIASGLYAAYARYSCNDIELTMQVYRNIMSEGFPPQEILLQDMVLRCAVQPKFALDQGKLAIHLNEVQQSKEELMQHISVEKGDLMSNDKFAEVLRDMGVDPPTKTSLATGKTTYAFAKTDPAFIALEEHEDEDVQALVAARMGMKSTLEETRTQRFLSIANLTWPGNEQRLMPVPLRYGAAHTHRFGGDWKLNLQNMPRGSKKKPPRLRESLLARAGTLVVKADASQIEARFVADFCGQRDLVARFEAGEDVYASLASKVFGFAVNKDDHPPERFIGKTAVLGCGFGVGGEKFAKTVRMDSKKYTGTMIQMDTAEGTRVVTVYRTENPMVPLMWRRLNDAIPQMTRPGCSVQIGPITIEHERVRLPSGLFLNYKDLAYKEYKDEKAWWFTYAGKPHKIYGGKFLENIIQSLARIATMEAAIRIKHRLFVLARDYNFDPALLDLGLQEHDALAYCPPADFADMVGEILVEEMVRRPMWAPTVPLACQDGYGVGLNYADAK
jgi:hypothetical protein